MFTNITAGSASGERTYAYDSGSILMELSSSANDEYLFDFLENTSDEPWYLQFQLNPVSQPNNSYDSLHYAQHNNLVYWFDDTSGPTSPYFTKDYWWTMVRVPQSSTTNVYPFMYYLSGSSQLTTSQRFWGGDNTHVSPTYGSAFYVLHPSEGIKVQYKQLSSASNTCNAYIRLVAIPESTFIKE